MINASKMTFEEWMKAKEEENRRITHGAEEVKEHGLYDIEIVINEICFNKELFFMHLYYIPPDLDRGSRGLFGYFRIMISKPFYEEHGIDDAVINTMFHECVHAWDKLKGIKDTDGDYHNEHFKAACEAHGGYALFTNAEDGYNEAHLTEETMQRIKATVETRQRYWRTQKR